MTISISDPLTLFPYQAGLTDPPLVEAAAKAANDLATTQRAYKIGDPVPIVFCRRVDGNGGVLVSPGATEGRWENDGTTNELTVSLMVVLSEGELATIPIKDCFVGPCRQGTWAQTYDRRAGSWTPGNYLTTVSGKQPWTAPYYCGTSGSYDNMTTLSCVNSYIDGSQRSGHQLHVFVRSGMEVTRIIDSTAGPSNNVVDLALYLMDASGRVPSGLIDTTQMLAAANFTEANDLHFNGVYEDSRNLDDWLEEISNDFLLRLTEKNGKFGFRPRLPVNVDHTINTGVIDWEFTFTEDHLLPDGFDIQYVPLTDRQPVCLQMMWRQQPESDIGFPRTTEIRFNGEATDGPFEQYDLSGFCTSENHAVKVGAFRLARRKLITHTLRLKVRPASYNSSLALGDIVRVRLRRETATTALNYHDYLYEVERIEKTASGACVFDLTHYPIDSQGRSLVALAVDAAVGPGVTLDPGRDDYSCDDNSATDDTGLPDTGIDYPAFPETPTSTDTDVVLDQPEGVVLDQPEGVVAGTGGTGGSSPVGPAVTPTPGQPIGDADNPVDPFEQTLDGVMAILQRLRQVTPLRSLKPIWAAMAKCAGRKSTRRHSRSLIFLVKIKPSLAPIPCLSLQQRLITTSWRLDAAKIPDRLMALDLSLCWVRLQPCCRRLFHPAAIWSASLSSGRCRSLDTQVPVCQIRTSVLDSAAINTARRSQASLAALRSTSADRSMLGQVHALTRSTLQSATGSAAVVLLHMSPKLSAPLAVHTTSAPDIRKRHMTTKPLAM